MNSTPPTAPSRQEPSSAEPTPPSPAAKVPSPAAKVASPAAKVASSAPAVTSPAPASTVTRLDSAEPSASGPTERLQAVASRLRDIIRGKEDVIDHLMIALLAEGSVLLEDVPGVGKTTLAKAVARLIDLDYQRVQCTPDLLPSDILGGAIFDPSRGAFEFRPGPVFCNLLLADEVNRASPRTQSALLEAMAEKQVSIDGTAHALKRPFLVIATQNPAGSEGTYPLPDSQLDRFLIRLQMDYPDQGSEIDLLLDQTDREPTDGLSPIMTSDDLRILQNHVRKVRVDRLVAGYVVSLAAATRQEARIEVGCSPRGSKMLLRAAQARAILLGRDFVLPDDVQSMAVPVLAHRISLRTSRTEHGESSEVIESVVHRVEVPV